MNEAQQKAIAKEISSGRKSIDDIAHYCEDNGLNLSQFTRLVIHNGYSEEEFTKWLEDRNVIESEAEPIDSEEAALDARLAKVHTPPRITPKPEDEKVLSHFEKGDADTSYVQGYKGGMKFVDT